MNNNDERRPNPVRPDPPLFAPVVFGDDDDQPPGRGLRPVGGGNGGYDSDAGLLRVLAVIVVLGLVIIALVLPWSPIRVIGGGGDDDAITARERGEAPSVPEGMAALSKLYEINVPADSPGPLSVEVKLTSVDVEVGSLAYYAWDGQTWSRLSPVDLGPDGTTVTGSIPATSVSLAVLRRTALAGSLALIVESGATPDPRAGAASIVAVVAARPAPAGTDGVSGEIVAADDALAPTVAVAGDARVLFGVTDAGETALIQGILGSPEATTGHIAALVEAARTQGAGGVYVDYATLPAADRDRYTAFVTALATRTKAEGMALVLAVPAPASADTGAYDWAALLAQADALWLRVPADPVLVFPQLEAGLAAQDGALLSRVSLIVDRRSTELSAGRFTAMSTRDALAVASTIDRRVEAIGPGSPVTLRAASLGDAASGGVLTWDETARSVSFRVTGSTTDRTVWVTNRYSVAFRLDLASRMGLGGVAIEAGSNDEALADIWEPVAEYLGEGVVTLMRPFGAYLVPCWQAEGGTLEGQGACFTSEAAPGTVVWRAPGEPGAYTIRLVVSDGVMFIAQELALRVGDEAAPTATPTPSATEAPTAEPTAAPTAEPTAEPTAAPTAAPTVAPTA
ncbi:MAG: PT domain-containing protein, partial [Dehalococcoidia bacterium]|nr:PT domain-containing protein [Dehalococcoidia bacterium]